MIQLKKEPRTMSKFKMITATFGLAATLAVVLSLAQTTARAEPQTTAKDVVDTAVAASQFKTLAAALKAADLIDTLKGEGPFTVFAPTDDAFAKLPAGTVDDLLKPENKQKLVDILTYHVVRAKATSKDVAGMSSVKTVNGKELKLKTEDGKVKVGDATVTKADVHASNGLFT